MKDTIPKICIICIASFNEPHFEELIRLRKLQYKKYNIPLYVVYDEIPPDTYIPDDQDIYIPKWTCSQKAFNSPLNPFMIQRFLQTSMYIDLDQYEYIVRVNISTYIHIHNLLTALQSFPRTQFCGGHLVNIHLTDWSFYTGNSTEIVSGTCMIFSQDVYKYVLTLDLDDPLCYSHNDDVILSHYTKQYVKQFHYIPMKFLETDVLCSVEDMRNYCLFRIKHYKDRKCDIIHWKNLLCLIDGIQYKDTTNTSYMTSQLEAHFTSVLKNGGDIDQHLLYLARLASNCNSVLECGVRSVVSSWAFLYGLTLNNSTSKLLHSCDMVRSSGISVLQQQCKTHNVEFTFFECNDLNLDMREYDMIFIDTWHIYGHLKRELEKFHSFAKKYIVMHDTEIDKIDGESLRSGFNILQQVKESGYAHHEICSGLGKAIDEFLAQHPEWKVKIHFQHQNGLTVLERVNYQ